MQTQVIPLYPVTTIISQGIQLYPAGNASNPVVTGGSEVVWDTYRVYGSPGDPLEGAVTSSVVNGTPGVVQKIYHQDTEAPSWPTGWVLLGAAPYIPGELNIVYAVFAGGSRVEYWISQEG